jgi:hypothetical protein
MKENLVSGNQISIKFDESHLLELGHPKILKMAELSSLNYSPGL